MDGKRFGNLPLVSILMPTFNGRQYIASAIRSLQTQDHPHLEIIVVDDGSRDDTAEIVGRAAAEDGRIVLVPAPHRGIAASRNEGLARARGGFITFLDHDDLCPPGKITRQLARLAGEPDAIAVFGRTLMFSSTEMVAAHVTADDGSRLLTVSLAAALFRRQAFERVGLLDPTFTLADDLDFVLRLCEAGFQIAVEEDVATLHRRHATQATADLDATRREFTLALAASLRRRRAAGSGGGLSHPLLGARPL